MRDETAIEQFLELIEGIELATVALHDLVDYKGYIVSAFASAHTCKLKLKAVKSPLSFAVKVGDVHFNMGAAIRAERAGNWLCWTNSK